MNHGEKSCIRKKLIESGLHVYYVRFDEGAKNVTKIW